MHFVLLQNFDHHFSLTLCFYIYCCSTFLQFHHWWEETHCQTWSEPKIRSDCHQHVNILIRFMMVNKWKTSHWGSVACLPPTSYGWRLWDTCCFCSFVEFLRYLKFCLWTLVPSPQLFFSRMCLIYILAHLKRLSWL